MKTFRKITFAFVVAALFAASGFAENCLLGPCKKADLPTCGSKLKGKQFSVTNCVTAISCATTASPGFANIMVCDYTGSAWAYRVANATAGASDLTGYVEVTKAGQQSITATGVGNDITFSTSASGDDILLNPGDDFNITFTPDSGDSFILNGGAPGANGFYTLIADNDMMFSVYDATRTTTFELNSGGVDFEAATGTYFSVDVGGGSTELYITGGALAAALTTSSLDAVTSHSFKIGAANKLFVSTSGLNTYGQLVGDGTGIFYGYKDNVFPRTTGVGTPYALTAGLSRVLVTNEVATAEVGVALPTAVAGLVHEACVQDADGLRYIAAADDTIRVLDKVTAAAGYISSTTIGSCITLKALNAIEWFTTSIHGIWTDGTFTYDDTSLTTP